MLRGVSSIPDVAPSDDITWTERCSHWLSAPTKPKRIGRLPRRHHIPLVLTGHGIRLQVNNGALLVRGGFTHYPQKQEQWRFFSGDPQLPSRIVVVDGSGSVSFDVLDWLAAQEVPLIRINWRGQVQSVLSGIGYSADPDRVAAQRKAQQTRSISIATSLIRAKIANSIDTLIQAIPASDRRQRSLLALKHDAHELETKTPKRLSALLGIEGRVAFHYFSAWQGVSLRWKGMGRKPIPKDWHYIGSRQSAIGAKTGSRNRNASHPVNSILNYAYSILESQIRIQIASEGYDPTIGFLHSSKAEREAFVFDLMEPQRPIVDRLVLEFVQAHTFHPADFTIRADGVCRLNPEMVRHVVRVTANGLENSIFVSTAFGR